MTTKKLSYWFYLVSCIIFLPDAFSMPKTSKIESINVIQRRSEVLAKSIVGGMHKQGSYDISIPVSNGMKNTKFLRTCYYVFGDPKPALVNGSLCTHIIRGFSKVANGVLTPNPSDVKYYSETKFLKNLYPDLKVMLSVGGGGNDAGFSEMTNSRKNRTKFIKSAIQLLTKYDFDGLDIDWEFPVWNGVSAQERPNFVLLMKEFKLESKMYSLKRMNSMLLSVAVAAPKPIIDVAYDIPNMAQYVDFINLMSYDYHDYFWYTPFTGHNSPLFNRSVEHAYFSTLNTAWSALYWSSQGMPMSKIMVGFPTYAHTYKLADPSLHGFDAPATGIGIGDGSMTFPAVCTFLANGGTRVFDEQSQVPYAYHNLDWIGYDDYSSIAAKAKWVKSKGFGGVMTFDLNCDDWEGICDGKTRFPLQQIIYDILES